MKIHIRTGAAALLAAATFGAQAGPIEDGFRQFIDGLKRAGQRIAHVMPGYVVANPYVMNRTDALPLARNSVVVFVGPNCPFCLDAVTDARKYAGVGVEVLDVSSSSVARDAFALTRAPALPATMAGSQILIGRDETLLRNLLGGAGMDNFRDQPAN